MVKRRVPKDKKTGLPKKYLGSTTGSKRAELARVLKRIKELAKAGKTIPRSLLKRRIELGRKKKAKSARKKTTRAKKKTTKRRY
jgi:cobyrinic acid a,c-diamide synthase